MCAQLRRRIPPVRLHVLGSVPAALVLQLRQEARHSSVGNGSGEPTTWPATVPHHSRHVQRLHHHAATRLGYRRRCLVMTVTPPSERACPVRLPLPIHDPGVKVAPLEIQPLSAAVRMGTLSMNVAATGDRPCPADATASNRWPTPSDSQPSCRPSIRPSSPTPNVHADGRSILHRWRWLSVLDAETRKPCSRGAVDGHLADGAMEPQMLHHGHPADLRQYDHLAVHPHSVRAVISTEALLMPSSLEPRKPDAATGTLTSLQPLAILSPVFSRSA